MSAVDLPATRTTIGAIRAAVPPLATKMMTIAVAGGAAAGLAIRKVIPRRPAAVVDLRAMTMTTIAVGVVVVAAGSGIRKAMPRRHVSAGRTIAAAAAVGRGQAVAMTRRTTIAADAAVGRGQAVAMTRTTIAADAVPDHGQVAAMMMTTIAVAAAGAVAAGSVTRKGTPKRHANAGRMTTAAAGAPDPEPAAAMRKMNVVDAAAPAPVDSPVGRAGTAILKAMRELPDAAGGIATRSQLI
jgi:hypothetical protein